MGKYWEESPLITENIDWDTILGNVPSTNIGMVPFQYQDWESSEGPQFGMGSSIPQHFGPYRTKVEKTGYVEPRDEKVKDLLNYSVNTELNPYDPSSQFFPYEKDYSGIMAATALKESGDPIYDIARLKDLSNIPPSMRFEAEYIRPESENLYGVQTTWAPFDAPTKLKVGLNVPKLEAKKGAIDSTLLHEARHYYHNKFGFDIGELDHDSMHNLIYQFQSMYNNPVDPYRAPDSLTKEEADAYMAMHKQGKEWYYNQGQKFLPSKAQTQQAKDDFFELMIAGQDKLGHTWDQRSNQFEKMYGYGDHQPGSYTQPTMSQQQMAQDAQLTGGSVNPNEATRAHYQPNQEVANILNQNSQPKPPSHHFDEGGIVGLPGQWSPSTIIGDEETFDIGPLQLDPGIMSIDDLEDLFEEAGLDKRIIYQLINTGGLSQLVS
jgi:hypothetical protein